MSSKANIRSQHSAPCTVHTAIAASRGQPNKYTISGHTSTACIAVNGTCSLCLSRSSTRVRCLYAHDWDSFAHIFNVSRPSDFTQTLQIAQKINVKPHSIVAISFFFWKFSLVYGYGYAYAVQRKPWQTQKTSRRKMEQYTTGMPKLPAVAVGGGVAVLWSNGRRYENFAPESMAMANIECCFDWNCCCYCYWCCCYLRLWFHLIYF